MSKKTITIDPVTRIEGHLKVDVVVDNGVVTDTQLSGAMARGIESLLIGKDPRDATYVTERICGVCMAAHGWTSSLAVEAAHGTTAVPEGARLIRNLIVSACWLHDHLLQFYQLSLPDYLDFNALEDYTGDDATIRRVQSLIAAEKADPQNPGAYAGPFLPGYAPDAYCVADQTSVVTLLQHYFSALQMQIRAKQMSALLGGKQPHQSTIVAGGVTRLPTREALSTFAAMLDEQAGFIRDIYIEDVKQLASGPLQALGVSEDGVGYQRYLSFGGFPEGDGFAFPEGVMLDGVLVDVARETIESKISEAVERSWYAAGTGGHPSESGEAFDLEKTDAYSFIKAPRFDGYSTEVGPLARLMIAAERRDHAAYQHAAVSTFRDFLQEGFKPGTVLRHVARALETAMLCDAMAKWVDDLDALLPTTSNPFSGTDIHDHEHWEPPQSGAGVGMTEAPRGALGHWIQIEKAKISHYACVTPTTWNASPLDAQMQRGPMEEALVGSLVDDAENPIGIARAIRAFDPCIACAVHMLSPEGREMRWIKIH